MSDHVRVREAAVLRLPDGPVFLQKGDIYSVDHPYVQGRASLFQPIEDAAMRLPGAVGAVETATAAPAERRHVRTGPVTPLKAVTPAPVPEPAGSSAKTVTTETVTELAVPPKVVTTETLSASPRTSAAKSAKSEKG